MKQQFIAWTDGSCDNINPQRPGGSAYIIFDSNGQEVKRASKGFKGTSNNRMEILAIMSVVNSLPKNSSVKIHSDSQYSINVLSRIWRASENLDQITRYWDICRDKNLNVEFQWVRGHDGNVWNELCDKMARSEYAKMRNEAKPKETPKPKKTKPETKKQKAKDTWTNELEEQYYNQVTTKGRRKKTKKR